LPFFVAKKRASITPLLTTIDQHYELMGRSATRLPLHLPDERDLHSAPRHLLLPPRLCGRASSLRRAWAGA
jgi:DNA-binding LacI/PurR family transcriptional regulator